MTNKAGTGKAGMNTDKARDALLALLETAETVEEERYLVASLGAVCIELIARKGGVEFAVRVAMAGIKAAAPGVEVELIRVPDDGSKH